MWEENYRRRARTMTRDYVNPNSTRLSHRRSRSADSRQQYSNRSNNNGRSRTNPPSYNFNPPAHQNPRAGCMNLIYPTEDEGRVTVAYDTSNQSLSQIPKPIAIYEGEDEDRTGRSLSRNSPSVNRTSRSQSPRRRPVTPSGIIDPYASGISSATKPRMRAQHHDYDHLKNSLIMFGDEPSSMGTGLSQEELLKRRDKEHVRETKKRGSPNRKRLVNLPTSLFNAHSSRQHQQQVQAQLYSRHQEEEEANFTPAEQAPRNIRKARSADEFDLPVAAAFPAASPIVTSYSSGYDPTTPQQHGFGTNLNFAEEPLSPDPPAYLAEEAAKRLRKAEPRGIRSSMVCEHSSLLDFDLNCFRYLTFSYRSSDFEMANLLPPSVGTLSHLSPIRDHDRDLNHRGEVPPDLCIRRLDTIPTCCHPTFPAINLNQKQTMEALTINWSHKGNPWTHLLIP